MVEVLEWGLGAVDMVDGGGGGVEQVYFGDH